MILNVCFSPSLSALLYQHKSTLAKIILILICLRIPKSKPMFNGSDCWIMAANAESRLA